MPTLSKAKAGHFYNSKNEPINLYVKDIKIEDASDSLKIAIAFSASLSKGMKVWGDDKKQIDLAEDGIYVAILKKADYPLYIAGIAKILPEITKQGWLDISPNENIAGKLEKFGLEFIYQVFVDATGNNEQDLNGSLKDYKFANGSSYGGGSKGQTQSEIIDDRLAKFDAVSGFAMGKATEIFETFKQEGKVIDMEILKEDYYRLLELLLS